jgi:hypothetical protein
MFLSLVILAVAAADPATTASGAPVQPTAADPNEKICENVTQIGSRLAKKRVCATRAEWAQRRLQDRQDAEYIQRGITTATCTAAKTNGSQTC